MARVESVQGNWNLSVRFFDRLAWRQWWTQGNLTLWLKVSLMCVCVCVCVLTLLTKWQIPVTFIGINTHSNNNWKFFIKTRTNRATLKRLSYLEFTTFVTGLRPIIISEYWLTAISLKVCNDYEWNKISVIFIFRLLLLLLLFLATFTWEKC